MNRQKILLPAFVTIAFLLYSAGLKHDKSNSVVTPVAKSSSNTTTSTSTTSGSSSTTQTPTNATATVYKDGTYAGNAADAVYGNIQIAVTIKSGKITAVQFLQYPNDRENSIEINNQAMPILQQETIQAQSAQIDGVSGATDTTQAFVQSLSSALTQAHA